MVRDAPAILGTNWSAQCTLPDYSVSALVELLESGNIFLGDLQLLFWVNLGLRDCDWVGLGLLEIPGLPNPQEQIEKELTDRDEKSQKNFHVTDYNLNLLKINSILHHTFNITTCSTCSNN